MLDKKRRRQETRQKQAVDAIFADESADVEKTSTSLESAAPDESAVQIVQVAADTALAKAQLAVAERKQVIDLEALRQRRAVHKGQMQEVYAQQLIERAKRQDDEDTMIALLLAA